MRADRGANDLMVALPSGFVDDDGQRDIAGLGRQPREIALPSGEMVRHDGDDGLRDAAHRGARVILPHGLGEDEDADARRLPASHRDARGRRVRLAAAALANDDNGARDVHRRVDQRRVDLFVYPASDGLVGPLLQPLAGATAVVFTPKRPTQRGRVADEAGRYRVLVQPHAV